MWRFIYFKWHIYVNCSLKWDVMKYVQLYYGVVVTRDLVRMELIEIEAFGLFHDFKGLRFIAPIGTPCK